MAHNKYPGLAWWRHQMETFSALLSICAGNSPITGEFPAQRPLTRSFDVFFELRLNKRLNKESWGWWFETPSRPLWRHCNEMVKIRMEVFHDSERCSCDFRQSRRLFLTCINHVTLKRYKSIFAIFHGGKITVYRWYGVISIEIKTTSLRIMGKIYPNHRGLSRYIYPNLVSE